MVSGETLPISNEVLVELTLGPVATSGTELQCSFPGSYKNVQPANHVMTITDVICALL
jgi:hypothetical protein